MNNVTVFHKLTSSTSTLINAIKDEIGFKCCLPFAVRAFDSLSELKPQTEKEAKRAANVFLDNLQTLYQGGIVSEDYDMLDFVKRGNTITISARVQALLRACRRKGFMVIDTVVAVPQGEDVYFEEVYKDGVGIIYLLKDKRLNPDRGMTAQRLIDGYFSKYICRLEIKDLKNNITIMTNTEVTNDEMMAIQSSSDRGIYASEWVEYTQGKFTKKKKVIYDGSDGNPVKLNKESFWCKFTGEMVRKSIIRKALKNVKETIPELADTYMAFSDEAQDVIIEDTPARAIKVEGVKTVNVDLNALTKEQQEDALDIFEIYNQNPEKAKIDAEEIRALYELGESLNEIINKYYAELTIIRKSKNLLPIIEPIINGVPYEKDKNQTRN